MNKPGIVIIKGVEYELFSVEKASEGGWVKRDLISILKEHGIKSTTKGAYSPYVGQYGLYVESKYADEVSSFLWSGKSLINHTKEKNNETA